MTGVEPGDPWEGPGEGEVAQAGASTTARVMAREPTVRSPCHEPGRGLYLETPSPRVSVHRGFLHPDRGDPDAGIRRDGWILLLTELALRSARGKSFEGRGLPPDVAIDLFAGLQSNPPADAALEKALALVGER
jgi:hypothetical protein